MFETLLVGPEVSHRRVGLGLVKDGAVWHCWLCCFTLLWLTCFVIRICWYTQGKKKSHLETLNTYTVQPKVRGHGRSGQTSERTLSSTCGGFGGSSDSLTGRWCCFQWCGWMWWCGSCGSVTQSTCVTGDIQIHSASIRPAFNNLLCKAHNSPLAP